MGWNVNFFMRFEGGNTLTRYFNLIEKLNSIKPCFRLKRVTVYNRSAISSFKIIEYNEISINIRDIVLELDIKSKNYDTDKFIYKSDFDVLREVRTLYSEKDDQFKIVVEPITASLFLRGPNASWNPAKEREDLNLIWQIGDFKNYDRDTFQAPWAQNIDRAVNEIKMLITEENIQEIFGSEESFDGNIKKSFLVYKNIKDNIACEVGNVHQIPAANLNEALALLNDAATIESIGRGLLIYSKKFINGNLNDFFQEFESIL